MAGVEAEVLAALRELQPLLSELQGKATAVPSALAQQWKESRRPVGDSDAGLAFLDAKLLLLLSYVIDHTFYLLLKVRGQPVPHHPVVDELLLLRNVLERLRPLDAKLKHQLDKLVRLTTATGEGAAASTAAARPAEEDEEEDFAPRPDSMVPKGQPAEDEDGGEAGDQSRPSAPGTYSAPKLAAVPYDEDARPSAKEARRVNRAKDKLRRSELLRTMRTDLLGTPDEMDTEGGAGGLAADKRRQMRREDQDREAWEEENFMRRRMTKKEKSQRKRTVANASKLETIADVGDVATLRDLGGRGRDSSASRGDAADDAPRHKKRRMRR